MTYWHAILLGLLQGVTEFLPVSSSGHLRVAEYFTGLTGPQTLFDVSLHAGSLLAIILVFRRDLLDMVLSPFRIPGQIRESGWKAPFHDSGFRGALLVVFGSIPTGFIGYYLGPRFENMAGALEFVAMMFIVNALILFASNRVVLPLASKRRMNTGFLGIRFFDAFFIGIAQGFAVIRGISRSGTTISAAMMLGVDRVTAGKFSFLLAIPAIVGALFLNLKDVSTVGAPPMEMMLIGAAVAFVSGAIALKLLMAVVRQGRFHRFGWYTLFLGLGLLAWLHYESEIVTFWQSVTQG